MTVSTSILINIILVIAATDIHQNYQAIWYIFTAQNGDRSTDRQTNIRALVGFHFNYQGKKL